MALFLSRSNLLSKLVNVKRAIRALLEHLYLVEYSVFSTCTDNIEIFMLLLVLKKVGTEMTFFLAFSISRLSNEKQSLPPIGNLDLNG